MLCAGWEKELLWIEKSLFVWIELRKEEFEKEAKKCEKYQVFVIFAEIFFKNLCKNCPQFYILQFLASIRIDQRIACKRPLCSLV